MCSNMRKAIAILLFCALPGFCALTATVQWDVRTAANSGADTNAGGFDPGVASPGTDESQGAGTAMTITLVTGTTGTCSPGCTSTTHGPGNLFIVASGTGCTVGTYEMLSQAAGTVTVDRTMGSSTDACVGVMGGSWLTMSHSLAGGIVIAGNTVWINSGTYTLTSSVNIGGAGGLGTLTVEGYNAAHGDLGTKPVITTSTNTTDIFDIHVSLISFINVAFLNTAGTPNSAIVVYTNSANVFFLNCKFTVPTPAAGIYIHNGTVGTFVNSEFAGTGYGIENTGGNYYWLTVTNCYFHNTGYGVWDANTGSTNNIWDIQGNVFSGNSYGLYYQATNTLNQVRLVGNVFYNTTTYAVNISNANFTCCVIPIYNNIFWGNAIGGRFSDPANWSIGVGLQGGAGSSEGAYYAPVNAYGSNTTKYTAGYWPISITEITLTADPFVSGSTGNFALNSTAGGGAALKATGFPAVTQMGTGYPDLGALQSQATSGGSGAYVQ